MASKLTFKKDYGTFDNKVFKGQSIFIDGVITYDKIKDAVKKQLGKTVGPIPSEYYTVEKS